VFLPSQAAVAKTATQTNILSTSHVGGGDTGTKEAQGVTGSVVPAPAAGEKVVVKYFKRHSGDWVLRGTHRPKTNDQGLFDTAFKPVAKHGTCKLTARYKGDDTYEASHTKVVIDCATGQVKQ
jgi:hypothetical protein